MNYDSNPTQPNPTMKEILSAREFEVLELIAHGCKDREIALALGIQDATVRFHVKNIVKKLGAKNRTDAACFAIQNGWIRDKHEKPKTIV